MENNVNISVSVVEDNRPSIANFGGLFGHRIFRAEKVACDLNFNEKLREARENNGITTSRSPMRYKVVNIDITSLKLDKDIDGSHVIVINEGRVDAAGNSVEVRCPIDNEKFTKDVTTENITEALNKKGYFFASGKKLVENLNPANQNEINRIDALLEALKKQREMIARTMEANTESVSAYYRQLDGKKEVKVTITD